MFRDLGSEVGDFFRDVGSREKIVMLGDTVRGTTVAPLRSLWRYQARCHMFSKKPNIILVAIIWFCGLWTLNRLRAADRTDGGKGSNL